MIDGLEMLRRIREIDGQTHLIAYTENETISQVKQALALGLDAFINTPDITKDNISKIMYQVRKKIWDANVKRQYIFEKIILDMMHRKNRESGRSLDFQPDKVLRERLNRKYYFFYLERVAPIPYIGIQNDFDNTQGEMLVFEQVQKLFEWHRAYNLRMDTPFRIKANRYMFLARMLVPMSVYAMEGNFGRYLSGVQAIIKEKLGLDFSIMAFKEPMTIQENFERYHRLPHQFYYKYWHEQPVILFFDERYTMEIHDYDFDSNKLAWYINHGDAGALDYIDEIFDAPLRNREYAGFMLLYQKLLNYLDSCWNMHLLSAMDAAHDGRYTVYHLVDLVKEMVRKYIISRSEEGRMYSPKIQKALSLIHQRYMEPELSIDTIADAVGYSSNHLNTLFKKETGRTLMACVIDYRMERAKYMLLAGKESISVIAMATGFTTVAYFTKVFKKYTGKSPTDFRN